MGRVLMEAADFVEIDPEPLNRYSRQHEFVLHSDGLLRVLLRAASDCGVNQP